MAQGRRQRKPPSEETLQLYADLKVLAAAAACILLVMLIVVKLSPPHEGDSSEYAALARNFYRSTEMREDLIKDYARSDLNIPHPTTWRGAFFSFYTLPFYITFKESLWAFVVPGAIAFLLTPLATFIFGRRFFGRKTAMLAAALTMCNPELIRLFMLEEPCQPDLFLMPLYAGTCFLFLGRRFWAAGALLGLACLTKQSAVILIPALFLYGLFVDRKRETLIGAGKALLVATLLLAPMMARNYAIFHNPFQSEAAHSAPRVYNELFDRLMDGDVSGSINDYEFWTGEPGPPLTPLETVKRVGLFTLGHARWMLFGEAADIGYLQGLIGSFHFVLFVSMLVGMRAAVRERERALPVLVFFLHILLILQSPHGQPRYIMPVFPFMYLLALHGLTSAMPNREKLAERVVQFVLLTDFVVFMAAALMVSLPQRAENNFTQLNPACKWLRARSERDDLILSFPYASVNFLCDQQTAAFPSGNLSAVHKVADRYRPRYLYFDGQWKGDRFPILHGSRPLISNGRNIVFTVDPDEMNETADAYLADADLHKYFWGSRFRVEILPPFFKAIWSQIMRSLFRLPGPGEGYGAAAAVAGSALAVAAFLLLLAGYVKACRMGVVPQAGAAVLLVAAGLALQVLNMLPLREKFPDRKPPASLIQVFGFLEHYKDALPPDGRAAGRPIRSVGINMEGEFLRELPKGRPGEKRFLAALDGMEVDGNLKFDASLDASKYDLLLYFEPIPTKLFTDPRSVEQNRREIEEYLERLERLKKLPSLEGRASMLFNGGILFY